MDSRMKFVLSILAIFFLASASAQKIDMTNGFGGVRYSVDTLDISAKQVLNIIQVNPTAYQGFKSSRAKGTLSSVLGFAGGVIVVLPLASMIIGGEPQWGWVVIGAAMIGIAIPIDLAQKRQARSAIDLYNSSEPPKAQRIKANLLFTSSGAGLVVRF